MTSRYVQKATHAEQSGEPIVSTMLDEEPELRDLVQRFVSELPAMLDKLHDVYRQEEWATLEDLLHDFKGMGGNFGYEVLSELAGKAEFQLLSENYVSVKNLLDDMNNASDCIYEGIRCDRGNFIECNKKLV